MATISPVRHLSPLILLFLLGLGTLYTGSCLAEAAPDPKLSAQQLKQLRGRIDAVQEQIQGLRGKKDRTQAELRKSEQRIGELTASIHDLEGEIRAASRGLAEIQGQMEGQRSRLGKHREALKQQVRSAYISGQEAYLKMVLNQQDPQLLGRMLVYYQYVNQARAEEIGGLQAGLKNLQELTDRRQATQTRLERLLARQGEERGRLEQSRKQRQTLVAALALELEDKEVELVQLQEDELRLEKLMNELTAALSELPALPRRNQPFRAQKGNLPWPLRGELVVAYNAPRNRNLQWKGVVLAASRDSEVRAVAQGRVAFSDWLRGYGLLTIIDHGDGYMSLYGQNQGLYKRTGEWVGAGEVIAKAGEGSGDQARLYFEIRHHGKPENPARWCRR